MSGPAAWRFETVGDTPAGPRCLVEYGDLTEALDRLAVATGATPHAVLTAAHVKVVSMLTEEHAVRTDVRWPGHGERAHTLHCDVSAVSTWRDLIAAVRDAAREPAPDAAGKFRGTRIAAADGTLTLYPVPDAAGGEELARLGSMYRRVLAAMADGPDGDAAAARLPDEERKALESWSAGPLHHRPAATAVDLIAAQAARTPDAPAVTVSGARLTYRELDERSNQIAHHLAGLGVRTEARVGVCLRRTADLLPALLGIWKAGAAYVPLDPDLPTPRLRRMASRAGCALVVTVAGLRAVLEPLDAGEFVLLDERREAIAVLPRTPVNAAPGPGSLAYVIYTSGSTGDPKGVLVEHSGLLNYLLWTAEEYAARGGGGSPFFTSIGFDLGVPSLFTPLLVGQRVDLLPDPLDLADLGALLADGAPYSFIKMTPGHLNLLSLDLYPEQAHDLAGLVIAAGDAFTTELARRWIDLAGPGGTPVATEYGPTEITVGNSGQRVSGAGTEGLVPLGAPIPNTTMHVLDDRLEQVPVGVAGEVHVGGAGVSRGYLDDPALTADRYVPDPYGPPGARLYRTGDRARWLWPGCLEFLGRVDHQVKIRGYRVEPGEVREALRRRAGVDEAVVIAHGPPAAQRLAAFVVTASGQPLDAAGLRADLAADLPAHMVPAEIVAIEAVPLTANGKVDRRALEGLL
ncbi:amino acid adenylation domain-containing protein [Micromonospora sp. CPCC 205371]|nr:amino acid adenylation domain-containing protein [Micromonospora sp. CPCC 205371]